jgi:hypothetical protein
MGRFLTLVAIVPLIVGGGMLIGSWQLHEHGRQRGADLAAFGGRATAAVEAPWWRLDLDPAEALSPRNWYEDSCWAEICARLRFTPEGGEEVTTTVCRRRRGLALAAQILTFDDALGRGVPLRWLDEEGQPEMRIRFTERAASWLRRQPGSTPAEGAGVGVEAEPPAGPGGPLPLDVEALRRFWDDVDDPFFLLLREWSRPAPAVTVAYRPEDPRQALPASLLREHGMGEMGEEEIPEITFIVLFALFGVVFWVAGCRILTLGGNRWVRHGLALGSLALLPWWSAYLGPALDWLWGSSSEALVFFEEEVIGIMERAEVRPDHEIEQPGDVELDWTLERSYYGPIFERLPLSPPSSVADDDELLAALSRQVAERVRTMKDDEAASLLRLVDDLQEREGEGEEIGLLFIEVATELCGDEATPEDLHSAACALPRTMRFDRPSDNPYRLAVEERQRLMALVDG